MTSSLKAHYSKKDIAFNQDVLNSHFISAKNHLSDKGKNASQNFWKCRIWN